MKNIFAITAILLISMIQQVKAQGEKDYIEFNDRRNVVHGVYLGFMTSYGKTDDSDTFIGSLKLAYVANQTFEVGFEAVGFYVDRYYTNPAMPSIDVYAGYGGLHLEPILFGRQKVNLAFPILIGGGGVFYNDDHHWIPGTFYDNWDYLFVAEPGASVQYNISRYLQVEAGVKYRFTSRVELDPFPLTRLDGWSVGIGIKFGIFNLGKNRYKKNL